MFPDGDQGDALDPYVPMILGGLGSTISIRLLRFLRMTRVFTPRGRCVMLTPP